MKFSATLLSLSTLLLGEVTAQLSGTVGPTTTTATKRAKKVCSVLDYGGKADGTTDVGPAILKAWNACASGGIAVVPAGNYVQSTWVTLSNGKGCGLQIDGVITRTGTAGGNMIAVSGGSDIEIFSSTGGGAIQANGYIIHETGSLEGARIIRFEKTTDFSLHDLKLIDAPAFFVVLDTSSNAELYNLIIRGGDHGGLDGIDIWGTNVHVHDVMVTNKDECVTVKSPASNILVEQVYCNWSGGSAIGSLSTGTAISNVQYSKVYSVNSNQMFMIKSSGGSGYVKNVQFTDFIGHGNAYSLDINQNWAEQSTGSGTGVALSNITFSNWKGTAANGNQRGPVNILCSSSTPCTGITITDFAVWTDTGSSEKFVCQNAYGTGACLKTGTGGTYSATQTISAAPAGYQAATLPDDIKTSLGFTSPIAIPASWPSSFYPGTSPLKALAAGAAAK